jgi:arylsulfatase A-like enzyme
MTLNSMLFSGTTACGLLLSANTTSGEAYKPNIVLILADDLGRMDTTPYGSTFHETPHIQRLADSGMRFLNAHSTSPVCSPARASIMTGLYAERLGMTQPACHIPLESLKATLPARDRPWFKAISPKSTTRLDTNLVTFAGILQKNGYRTGHIGKWHLGPEPYSPLQHGFDTDFPHTAAHGPIGSYFGPKKYSDTFTLKAGEHLDDKMAEQAVAFIQAHKNHPFFLNYWSFAVHAPPFARPELIGKYRKRAAKLPADAKQRNPLRAAMIETFDDHVGMILDSIESEGLADNTIVILCSDNGAEVSSPYSEEAYWGNGTREEILDIPLTSAYPLRGEKGSIYDGGTAVPCMVRWPGKVKPGSVSDAFFSGADFFPTFLEMAGSPMPSGLEIDGISQVPALLDKEAPRKVLYGFWPNYIKRLNVIPAAWIRQGDYKLIRYFADGVNQSDRNELYHVGKDPGEATDLAHQLPERVEALSKKLTQHFRDTRAVIPVANPAYDPDAPDPEK